MQGVTDNFKAAVNAPTRNIDVVVKFAGKDESNFSNARVYSSKDLLLSLKIIDGQTTGGFGLGGTICPSLTAELHKTAAVNVGDKARAELIVYNGGGNLTIASEFTVDNIKRKADGSLSVTALGNMIKLAKNYVSELTYPATQLQVLEEIAAQSGYELHPQIKGEIINNPEIQSAPIKGTAEDGTTLYFTRREMLGYAAAINGGAAYISQYGYIGLARHNDTGETFTHEQVFQETITEPYTIASVKWNSTGISYSLGDDYDENTVEFYNPLNYAVREPIIHNLETDLIGFRYDGAIIKKQGCGYFEVGDIVHYVDISGTTHDLLILGIVYEFSNSYFTETLYSLANTATQREYAGNENITPERKPDEGGTGVGGTIENAIIIEQNEIKHLLHRYVRIGYIHGNEMVYAGVENQIIVSNAIFHAPTTTDYYPQYGKLRLQSAQAGSNDTISAKELSWKIISYVESSKTYTFAVYVNGVKQGGNYATKDIGSVGFFCEYSTLYAPEQNLDEYPNGYVTGAVYIVYISTSGALKRYQVIGIVGFSDESEYNAAVGLRLEPVLGDEVVEMVYLDVESGGTETTLEKAIAYTDMKYEAANSLTDQKIAIVNSNIDEVRSDVSDNRLNIATNAAAIETINDPDTGILAQSKMYTDSKIDSTT